MSDTVPVVRVLHENPAYAGEFVEINASDYDPQKHTLYDDAPEQPAEPPKLKSRKGKE